MRTPSTETFRDRRPALGRHTPHPDHHPHGSPPELDSDIGGTSAFFVYQTLLGDSLGLHRVLDEIEMVAPTNATVLIHGETGVGKELVARSIHQRSRRHNHPMVTVNCTAVPRDL